MHARWTWFAGSVRERETLARSDNSFSENDTSITRRGAAITISPSANPPKGDMDIVKPKGNPPDACGFMKSKNKPYLGHRINPLQSTPLHPRRRRGNQ